MKEPNFFGLSIGYDPYMDELMMPNKSRTVEETEDATSVEEWES